MNPKTSIKMQKAFEKEMNGKWHISSGCAPESGWYYSEDLQRALRCAAEVMINEERTVNNLGHKGTRFPLNQNL